MAEGTNGSQAVRITDDPEYRAAVEKESQARAEAFVPGLRKFICGIEVLPLTFAHMTMLRGIGSPFVSAESRTPHPVEIVQFLWCISPQYRAAQALRDKLSDWLPKLGFRLFNRARLKFIHRVKSLPYVECVKSIDGYMDQSFADSPGGNGRVGYFVSYYSGEASLAMRIANYTGWSKAEIMNEPVECIWQYLRFIAKDADPKTCFINGSDKERGKALIRVKERNGHG